jgi:hypothetical protein
MYNGERSAWECSSNRSAVRDAERPYLCSHAERGNQEKIPLNPPFSKGEVGGVVFANPNPICRNTSLPFIHGK